MSGSSVRMVAVAVVALLVGGLVGCGDRSSSTLVTSLPTTTAAEEAPAEVPDPSTTTVEPDPTTTTTVEPDPVQDPTTTVAEEAPAEVPDPSTTTVESDPGPSSTTTVEPEPVSPTTTTTTTVEAPAEVTEPSTTTSVVSDPVQDPTPTTSVVSDPGPGPSTTIVEPEPVSPTTTTTTTVDPGLVGVGNEFSGEPVSEVGGDETLDFVEVALPPAGWDGRLPEPVGERLPYLLPKDDGWAPPDIRPENWDRRKREDGAWVSEVVDFRVGTVREPTPFFVSADPSAEEQASFDSAYGIVVAMVPVLPSDVGIGSAWLIYWCDVNLWWYRQEFPETVNGYMVVLPAYKVEGGFREKIGGANVGPC